MREPDNATDAPAIRFVNYMSGREETEAVHIIGPYASVEARDRDLNRLERLPLGAPEYNGGVQFFTATMAEAVGERNWSLYTAEPEQVAAAATVRRFFAAFHGYAEEEGESADRHDHRVRLDGSGCPACGYVTRMAPAGPDRHA